MSTQELSIVPPELENAVATVGLSIEGAQTLRSAFAPHFVKFHQLAASAASIDEASPMAARRVRLDLKAVRVAAEKTRKELKEDSLRRGKAIDGINNLLEYQLVPVEQAMEKIEKAEELREAARIAALKASREAELLPYQDPSFFNLGAMPEIQWLELLANSKASHQAKIESAAKAEAERIAAEKAAEEARKAKEAAEAAERERMKAENARLAKIAAEERAAREESERAAAKQRAEADEAARKERLRLQAIAEVERQKAQAEREKLAAIEREQSKAKEEAARLAKIAAAAPEREKLLAYADKIASVDSPVLTNTNRQRFIAAKVAELVAFIKTEANNL